MLSIFPLVSVLVRVTIAVMRHHDQKSSWGGKGLFGLHFHIAPFYSVSVSSVLILCLDYGGFVVRF